MPDEDGDGYAADAADPRLRDCDDDDPSCEPRQARDPWKRRRRELRRPRRPSTQDGDDWDDDPGPDCDPTNERIHPEARDKPRTKADENCDGRNARFPRVTSEVSPLYLAVRGRTVGFAQFEVLPARKGDRVRIECEGGNCPYSAKTYTVRRSRSELVVGKEFRPRLLKPGASVTVKILRSGHIGRAVRYTLRAASGQAEHPEALPAARQGQAAEALLMATPRAWAALAGARAAGRGGRVRGRPDDASGAGGSGGGRHALGIVRGRVDPGARGERARAGAEGSAGGGAARLGGGRAGGVRRFAVHGQHRIEWRYHRWRGRRSASESAGDRRRRDRLTRVIDSPAWREPERSS